MTSNRPKLVIGKSVAKAVREVIDLDFSIQDALSRDYANLSALSRLISPTVSTIAGHRVSEEGVITALKRVRRAYGPRSPGSGKVIAQSVVTVRTHVSKLSVERTKRTLQSVSNLLVVHSDGFIQVSESNTSITLIFDKRLHPKVSAALRGAEILEEGDDFAAITVESPEEIISTPGCISEFYDQLARGGVNIEDTVSCYTDTILVVKMSEVGKAFSALSRLISEEGNRAVVA